ncbi:SGNH/GDSL hydrolase family protein [Maribacter sp. ANRC-HE7]|uniref:SGNH/GDSL hydrolase family protein n=1 Tax=Maribacter aquimaris TaxID=2737171 RepID=A0ABR7UZ44_9FLAO|nr:GDSL-type esterase/lipase family protein [Maribacter aquimaris]MBD0777803.1 SGNH/GDSL hydrolase family protein [Maribacter aquimaris]
MKKIKIQYGLIFLIVILNGCGTSKDVIRENIEWSDFWWENEPDTSKPRVLFIGNSITRGYFKKVSSKLSEKANCDRYATSRSIADPALIKETKIAMGRYDHSVIHFNNGLHGWHLNGKQYEEGLKKFVKFLKKHKSKDCKILYSLTTPVPSKEPDQKLDPEKNGIILERNSIARRIMAGNGIQVIDLYGLMEPELEKYSASKGDVHYKEEGYEKLAGYISGIIGALLND